MPTIFDYRSDKFEETIDVLNDAKAGNIPNIDNLILLKGLFNSSLVETTKLWHFINPVKFAAFRIVELLMYLNGEKNITKENQRNANSS